MGIFKKSLLELVVVIVVLLLLFLILNFFADDYEEGNHMVKAKINEQELILEVADNRLSQEIGLSGREFLEENSGMIFVYDYEMEELSFWMKDTLIPLDIFFLDKDFEIVYIIENMEPCIEDPCPKYISQENSQYAIEVNAGWAEKNSVEVGNKLEFINQGQSGS